MENSRQKAKAALHAYTKADENGGWIWRGSQNRKNGYGRLCFDGKVVLSHRLCNEIYNGPIPPGFEIDHLDSDRLNITPSNLEAVTRKMNAARASRRGAYQGRSSYLTKNEVFNMKALAAAGIKRKAIAEIFETPAGTLSSILHGKSWSWLEVPGT